MLVTVSSGNPIAESADILITILHDEGLKSSTTAAIDQLSGGLLTRLIASGELSSKIGKASVLYGVNGVTPQTVLVVGGGSLAKLGAPEAYRIAGSAVKRISDRARDRVVLAVDGLAGTSDSDAVIASAIIGALNANVGQDTFRAEKNIKPCRELVLAGTAVSSAVLQRGEAIARAQLLVRELVNLPPNKMTPESFAERAAEVCSASGITLEVWDEIRLRRERCDSLLAVAQGSARPPRLLIMRYAGKKTGVQPVALVGKGVTFDSGGYSIKPTDGMLTMKCDMAGAATVLGTLQAAAALQIEQPIVGLVGLVENLISGTAFKLGDVLTARSGTTIEIHNTDAEGRLVLADVLNVALDEKPIEIIDLATLTGACVVALGTDISGLMGNDADLQQEIQQAAEQVGEYVWPLPMYSFFDEQINGQVADIKNVGDGRWGGAITAAKFLQRFVGETPWLHIDIAGPAFADKPKGHYDAGGTGAMLRTLVQWLSKTRKA